MTEVKKSSALQINCHGRPLLTDYVNRFFHFTTINCVFSFLDQNVAHDCKQDAVKLRGRTFSKSLMSKELLDDI